MRNYSFHDALARHPEVTGRPVSVSALQRAFTPGRRSSCLSLLIRMGPFEGVTDAFLFPNAFPLTEEAASRLESFFAAEVEAVALNGINRYLQALQSFRFSIPGLDDIPILSDIVDDVFAIPGAVINQVIDLLESPLRDGLAEIISSASSGQYGRCGGMAFAAYDYYQDGRQAAAFGEMRPAEGSVLDDYILDRLIDSLTLNARKFLDWLMTLYVFPHTDELATAALLAAAGEGTGGLLGAALGAVIGAWIGSNIDVFDFGGEGELLGRTSAELSILKAILETEAAWPIGLIFGNKKNPIDQHQLLALNYEDADDKHAVITVWDNRDADGKERRMLLDLSEDRLVATGTGVFGDNNVFVADDIKGIFAENYTPSRPPTGSIFPGVPGTGTFVTDRKGRY